MSNTLTYTGRLTVTSCWCGIGMALPEDLYIEAKRSKKHIYCPLGHTWVVSRSFDDERRELESRLETERHSQQFWREQALHNEKRLAAQKGVTTKLKKRIANGVCPCCKRHFANVERHVKNQHPDFTGKPTDGTTQP